MPDVTITPSENGPYIVSGPVTLVAPDGHQIEHPDPMSICRCGGALNKPFCDGTHAPIDFYGTRAIAGHPSCCGRVGAGNAPANHSRTAGWNSARDTGEFYWVRRRPDALHD